MITKTLLFLGAFVFGLGQRAFDFAQAGAAATGGGFDVAEFGRYGLIGLVLGFVLLRMEPRLKGIETALYYLAQLIRLILIEMKATSPGVRDQAVSIGEEMKAKGLGQT